MSDGAEDDPDEDPIEEILDTIGDRRARHVLATVAREPRPAKEIAESLDLSLPTVYRRLEELQENDLVEDCTVVSDDGNHYSVYACTFDSTVISLDDGEYDVMVFRKGNAPERFAGLWDDLSRGSG